MASTRFRLTVSFAGVLVGTMVAFGIALMFARRAAANEQLGREAAGLADDVLLTLRLANTAGRRLTIVDRDEFGPRVRASPEMAEILGPRAGFFLVIDRQDKLLYSSTAVRLLNPDDQSELNRVGVELSPGGAAAIVPVALEAASASRLLVVARSGPGGDPNIERVVAAIPIDAAELAPQLLLGTMLALLPVVLLISIVLAYWIAGRAFQPVEQLINEVEAITDGRSLHRRLPADHAGDELARLTTTLNAMIGRLEHSFSGLRRFTADASHELKTPLAVLRADVERAMHPGTTSNERLVALEEALQETARMADLVESLLTLARADEGRFDLHREPVALEPLVREVFETAVILGEDAGLTIPPPLIEPAMVLGDKGRLRQLFLNLVTNAIKYTPRGGRVEIALVRRTPSDVAFSVRDTGIGIAAADLPYVFERFWRADRVRTRAAESGGSGLGLAISQWIVQAHGGTINVQSRLGRGSLFTVVLPTVSQLTAASGAEALSSGTEPPEAPDEDFTNS